MAVDLSRLFSCFESRRDALALEFIPAMSLDAIVLTARDTKRNAQDDHDNTAGALQKRPLDALDEPPMALVASGLHKAQRVDVLHPGTQRSAALGQEEAADFRAPGCVVRSEEFKAVRPVGLQRPIDIQIAFRIVQH